MLSFTSQYSFGFKKFAIGVQKIIYNCSSSLKLDFAVRVFAGVRLSAVKFTNYTALSNIVHLYKCPNLAICLEKEHCYHASMNGWVKLVCVSWIDNPYHLSSQHNAHE